MENNIKLLVSESISPQDIAILILVSVYAKDPIQKYHRPIAQTIIDLLDGDPSLDTNNDLIVVPTAIDLCNRLKADITKYPFIISDTELHESIDSVQNEFLQELWQINSPVSLDSKVLGIMNYVENSKLISFEQPEGNVQIKFSTRSVIGNFIEKVAATIHYLHFDELFLVYEALTTYRETTRALFLSFNNSIDSNIFKEKPSFLKEDQLKSDNEDTEFYIQLDKTVGQISNITVSVPQVQKAKTQTHGLLPISKEGLESLLSQQVKILQISGTATPQQLKDIMELMTNPNSNVNSLQMAGSNNIQNYYYIKFLECILALDYQGSFKALHQYFDYMVSNNSKYFYHYALLSKASLHEFFGEDEKALDSIEEAISVARENSDNTTLTHILNWLFNFMRNRPHLWKYQNFYHNNNESHLLDFLVKKSKLVSFSLYTMSYQFECLHIIDTGGFMSTYMESLFKAAYVSINDCIPSFIKSMELSSNIWTKIGNPSLSEIYCTIADDFAKDIKKVSDEISIEIRKAFLAYLRGDVQLGYRMLEELIPKVEVDESLIILLQRRRLIMLVCFNVNKGRYKLAEKIIVKLLQDDIKDIELRAELIYLNAKVLLALGNYSQAMVVISSYTNNPIDVSTPSTISHVRTNLYTIMRLNLIKCQIFAQAKNPSRALSLLIQQLQQAKRIGFVSIVVEGVIILGSILNGMSSYLDSYKILSIKMITILSVGNKEFIALGYYELSKACVNIIKTNQYEKIGKTSKEVFNMTLKYLQFSINLFNQLVNSVMLQQCFELELELGTLTGKKELVQHSKDSISKSITRFDKETSSGFIE